MNPFSFFKSFFWRKLHLISLFFVHYNVIQLRYFWWNYFFNNFSLLDGFLRLVGLLLVYNYFIIIIDQQNVGMMTPVLQKQFLFCLTWSINQLLLSNIFFLFLQTFFYLSTSFLSVLTPESSVILESWILGFWLLLVLLWKLWMLVTMYKACHVPHASRITTWQAILMEIFFGVQAFTNCIHGCDCARNAHVTLHVHKNLCMVLTENTIENYLSYRLPTQTIML